MVSVAGQFPDQVYVWFGDQPGDIIHQSENWILVNTPSVAVPATVDVSIRRGDIVLTVPQAYTFFDPSGGQPPAAGPLPDGIGGGQPDNPADTSPPTTSPGSGGPGQDSGPTTTSAAVSTSTTSISTSTSTPGDDSDEPLPKRRSRATALGEPIDLGNGLTGTPLGGLESVLDVPRCASDPCRTRRA